MLLPVDKCRGGLGVEGKVGGEFIGVLGKGPIEA